MRQAMKEKGVLEDFLKHHKYDPGRKYHLNELNVAHEPMTNYLNVSIVFLLSYVLVCLLRVTMPMPSSLLTVLVPSQLNAVNPLLKPCKCISISVLKWDRPTVILESNGSSRLLALPDEHGTGGRYVFTPRTGVKVTLIT